MSNPKRMKIMKKLFYSALALAGVFAVSCNKEVEAPVAEGPVSTHTVTIHAVVDAETRTAYANDKTFSWVEGDQILVYSVNEATEMAYMAKLTAQSSGTSVDFTGEIEDGYEPYSLAFYSVSATWDEENFYVYLPGTTTIDGDPEPFYNVSSSNPMSNVPLFGTTDGEGVFHFTTMTGVLKFNLTDLDEDATYFELQAVDSNMLQGWFAMDSDNGTLNRTGGREGTYEIEGQTYRYSYSNLFYRITPDSEGKASIYVPVPVGTLGAGATIQIYNSDDEIIFSQSTTKDITVTRNKITELIPLKAKIEWETVGTGKYGDHYHFNDAYDQDVEIQRSSANPNEYRIVKPYAGYIELMGEEYEQSDALIGPSEYLNFRILKKGERVNGVTVTHDDLVWFDAYYTGMLSSSYGVDPFFAHPSRWGNPETDWLRSIVVKYQADGVTPANIQLAPVVFWLTDPDAGSGYWSGSSYLGYNNLLEIKFPGAERIDLDASVSYVEIADSNPAQAVALVAFEHSSVITGAKIVIAADDTDAAAALADASRYTVAVEAGEYEVKLPANAPSGEYYVYAQTSVVDAVTPVSAQLLVSEKFKYFNANSDLGYTYADIVGSYSVYNYHYNAAEGDWILGTMTFKVEESDDPLSGDIMFTNFFPEVVGYFSNLTYTSSVYAYFNTATGEVTIPGGQAFAASGGASWVVGEFTGEYNDVHMILQGAGSLQVDGNVAFYAYVGGESYGRYMWTNKDVLFTRSASSAPALAPSVRGGKIVKDVVKGAPATRTYTPATPAFIR